MAFWGGMGGGGGGHWHGGGGGMGGMGGMGGQMRQWREMSQQGLRRSIDAWDDEELGAAYNHTVVMRLMAYLRPYMLRSLAATASVVIGAVFLNVQPKIISRVIDAALRGDTGAVTNNGAIFLALALGAWIFGFIQLLNAGWMGHPGLRAPRARR